MVILIADSGATKCEWCLVTGERQVQVFTQGMSPYFLSNPQLAAVVSSELLPHLGGVAPDAVYFYGTGCKLPENARKISNVLSSIFSNARVHVTHDLMGAARALCQRQPGIACILGTGSNSCSFDGTEIVKNSPGLGYVLGDEGSGAYLGIRVIQHDLYEIFDEELRQKFADAFQTNADIILESVYRKPLPNRYLASFAVFLSENRGHYMIENIIEDGLRDFFDNHILRYEGAGTLPVHFTGGIAYYFMDVVESLCETYGLRHGTIIKNPMEGLINYHLKDIR